MRVLNCGRITQKLTVQELNYNLSDVVGVLEIYSCAVEFLFQFIDFFFVLRSKLSDFKFDFVYGCHVTCYYLDLWRSLLLSQVIL